MIDFILVLARKMEKMDFYDLECHFAAFGSVQDVCEASKSNQYEEENEGYQVTFSMFTYFGF
jgi:hypothetical protein